MNAHRVPLWQGAIAAKCVEEMFVPGVLKPALHERLADEWDLIDHITAQNAIFGLQSIGLGERVFFGFVAQSRLDPLCYIAVIRGTETSVEWFEDFEAAFVPNPYGPGNVALGMNSVSETMQFSDMPGPAAISIANILPEDAHLTWAGHSLGAPLATYSSALCVQQKRLAGVYGQFFASPKPGDRAYGDWFDALIGRDNYDVANYIRDLVPRAPAGISTRFGFQPLPKVQWIRPRDSAYVVPDGIAAAHDANNYSLLLANLKPVPTQGVTA